MNTPKLEDLIAHFWNAPEDAEWSQKTDVIPRDQLREVCHPEQAGVPQRATEASRRIPTISPLAMLIQGVLSMLLRENALMLQIVQLAFSGSLDSAPVNIGP
jgi:hypothetical protein